MQPQRQIALVAALVVAMAISARSFSLVRPSFAKTVARSIVSSTTPLRMAAPGVEMASKDDILGALGNPATTVVDARSVGELDESGYYVPPTARWVHAEATKHEAPLLEVAAEALLPDKDAPVVIYCGSGLRATTCKRELEKQGYTNVLNAGGLSDLNEIVQG